MMTCREFHDQVDLFALGAVTPAERAALEAHVAAPGPHDHCDDALREARDAAALIPLVAARRPRARTRDLWPEIERRIDALAAGTAAPVPARPVRRASRRRRPLSWAVGAGIALAAAAALAFLLVRLLTAPPAPSGRRVTDGDRAAVVTPGSMPTREERLRTTLDALRKDPATKVVPFVAPAAPAADAITAELLVAADASVACVVVHGTPPAGTTFHVWLAPASHLGALIPIGPAEHATAIDPAKLLAAPPAELLVTREHVPSPTEPAPSPLRAVLVR